MSDRPRRQRLDLLLVERGLAESRTKAQALVMAGAVVVGEARIDKPGSLPRVSPKSVQNLSITSGSEKGTIRTSSLPIRRSLPK